jgi:ATP-dependent Clp protease ATP-binding subunit ClpA
MERVPEGAPARRAADPRRSTGCSSARPSTCCRRSRSPSTWRACSSRCFASRSRTRSTSCTRRACSASTWSTMSPTASGKHADEAALPERAGEEPADAPRGEEGEEGDEAPRDPLAQYCTNLNALAAAGASTRSLAAPWSSSAPSGAVPPPEEQPALVGDPGVGKTAIAEGLALAIHEGRVPDVLGEGHDLLPRHGRAARGHQVPRAVRGAPQGRAQGAEEAPRRGALHRRDPHHRGRRGHLRRQHGRVQPAQARARLGHAALHRVDHLPGVQAAFERDRALARRFQKIEVGEPSLEESVQILEGLGLSTRRTTT